MKVMVMTGDEQILTLDVDLDESVEKSEGASRGGDSSTAAAAAASLQWDGKDIQKTEKLSAIGVRDGDLVMMFPTSERPSQDGLRVNPDGTAVNPQAFQQHAQGDSHLMVQLLQNDPQLAQAILGDDTNELQNILRSRHQQRTELKRKQEEELVGISLLNFICSARDHDK